MGDCSGDAPSCIDKTAALELKIGAIVTILVTSGIGVCIPLLGRTFPFLRPDRDFFFVVKAFAAGVILGTAFIHMLPDAFETLGNPCLAENPWGKFPFAGLISMFAALSTLLIDFWANTYYQNKNKLASSHAAHGDGVDHDDEHGHGSSEKQVSSPIHDHGHGHSHGIVSVTGEAEAMKMQIRQRIISQVLEAGIVAHSVIIGITLGTSYSPCTVRPLFAALTFHQFFEGIALGGCVAQGGFKLAAKSLMAFFFMITTPLGIGIGIAIASGYDENSSTALLVTGIFDSISAGILVYMSLVDLLAADFFSKRLQSSFKLQLYYYCALFSGAGAMSLLGYWA